MNTTDIGTLIWPDYLVDAAISTFSVDPDFTLSLVPTAVTSDGAKALYRGSIKFCVEGVEMLRLAPDGNIFVRGELAANDRAIVAGMAEMLRQLNLLRDR